MEIIKNNICKIILLSFFIVGLNFYGEAQGIPGVYVYPEKNQSHDQQVLDEHACAQSAQQEVNSNPTPQEDPAHHKTLKRTGAGAGIGAIIGGGKGAAIGAGAGAISGRRSKHRDEAESNAMYNDDMRRAYSSCLKSKGYSVE